MNYGSISNSNASIQSLAADAQSLGNLKMEAGKNSAAAIKETAKQFESLFMRELIKSMREATMKSGLTDSPGGDLGADLLDQQLATKMTGMPGGLSDLIAKQLSGSMGVSGQGTGDKIAGAAPMSASRAALSARQTTSEPSNCGRTGTPDAVLQPCSSSGT